MSDLNNVTIMGRLTRDAELHQTAGGRTYIRFSIAVNRTRKKDDGYVDSVSFFTMRLHGPRWEGVFPYLKKGQLVAVEGHLEQWTWEKDGERRSSTEIGVEALHLAGRNKPSATSTEADDAAATSTEADPDTWDDPPEAGPEDYYPELY